MYKNWLKTWNYKTSIRKHRVDASWYWIWQWFLRYDINSTGNQSKNRHLWLNQIKTFLCIKGNWVKPTKWQKIFGNHVSNQRLTFRIKNSYNSTMKNNTKIGKGFEETFHKEDIQMALKHINRCSASQIAREMQVSTTMRYDTSAPLGWPLSKHQKVSGVRLQRSWNPCALLVGM